MPLFHAYKPATSSADFINMFGYRDVAPVGSHEYMRWLVNASDSSENKKYEILKHLSATHALEQLEEYRNTPAEWLNTMFDEMVPWGVNGNLVESFFYNLVRLAEDDPIQLSSLLTNYSLENFPKHKKLTKSVTNILSSIKEDALNFSPAERRKIFIKYGFRYQWARDLLEPDSVFNLSVGTSLDKVLTADDYPIFGKVILALACVDRIDAKGSAYTQEDYENITQYWKSLINFDIKSKAYSS